MRVACPVDLILLDLISQIIFSKSTCFKLLPTERFRKHISNFNGPFKQDLSFIKTAQLIWKL
jgi:hypothetical protein